MSKIQEFLHCSSVVSMLHLKLLDLNAFSHFENQAKAKLFIILKWTVRFIEGKKKLKITSGFLLPIGLLVTIF